MTRHLSDRALVAFVQGALGDSLSEADAHLGECGACRRRLEQLVPVAESGLRAAVRSEIRRHLSYDELEGLHERTLDRESEAAARQHLRRCDSCREEWADFESFADELATPVADTPSEASGPELPSLGDRIRAWFAGSNLALAGATAVVLLGVWLGVRTAFDPAPTRTEMALAAFDDTMFGEDRAFRIVATLDGRSPRGSVRPVSLAQVAAGPVVGLSYPVGEATAELRPVLEWAMLDGPPYRIEVRDAGGELIVESGELRSRSWPVGTELAPDTVHSWSVRSGNGVAGPAEFRTLSSDEIRAWAEARDAYPEHPVLLGVIAQDLGLFSQARGFYEAELELDPDSELARRLLGELETP